jgi:transcriptional regulator with XRE-family HTH domain
MYRNLTELYAPRKGLAALRSIALHSVVMRHYERLDAAIDARRLDLDLSWKDLADRAGISDVSLRNFRKGRSEPNPLSKHRIEDALAWHHGSVDEILSGGDPTPEAIPEQSHIREARRLLIEAVAADDADAMREALARALTQLNEALDN